MQTTDELFHELQNLGAGEFAHLNGSLAEHLRGTEALLRTWGANETICRAGLFHAAYGTAGYGRALASLSLRSSISELIGVDAERLVYFYCSCDRQTFYARIGTEKQNKLPDRFTGTELALDASTLSALCELTAANETEIGASNTSFRTQYGAGLLELFRRMNGLLSAQAQCAAEKVFGTKEQANAVQPHPGGQGCE